MRPTRSSAWIATGIGMACLSQAARGQCDTTWSGGFGFPSPNGRVLSLAHFDGESGLQVIAGGLFTAAGGRPARHIASWSEANGWRALTGDVNDYVGCLAVFQGELYAGGRFTSAGTPGTRSIAKWNGQFWSSVGGGVQHSGTSFVFAMKEFGGELVVGGVFSQAGTTTVSNLASWNGTEWRAIGNTPSVGTVYDLEVWNERLIAGGSFTSIDEVPAACLAQWDGSEWTALGGVAGGNPSMVQDLLLHAEHLYVCGSFSSAGGVSAKSIARSDGKTWESLGSGLESPPSVGLGREMCVFGDELIVSGEFRQAGGAPTRDMARWNGQSWSAGPLRMSPGTQGPFAGPMLVHDDKLVVGGSYVALDETLERYVAAWDGESFEMLGSGDGASQQISELAVTTSGLVALGGFDMIGDEIVRNMAVYDGQGWSKLGGGIDVGAGRVAIEHQGQIHVGGIFSSIAGVAANGLARWDGKAWTALPVGPNSAITCATIDGGSLVVAGTFGSPWELSGTRVLRWDGVAFSPVGGPVLDDVLTLCVHDGELHAGGWFPIIGGTLANRVAKWTGATWMALGSGMSGPSSSTAVYSLVSFQGDLIAGGSFAGAGGSPIPHLARWTGAEWSNVGGGVDAAVETLLVHSGSLYVAGSFSSAGGVSAPGLARYDGASWYPLDGPTGGGIAAMAAFEGDLYLGGAYWSGPGSSTHFSRLEVTGPPADLDGDQSVGLSDLAILLSQFGFPDPGEFSGDFDQSGSVDLADLAVLLAQFGQRCP